MHATAQYLEALVLAALVSLGLGLAAAWGLIQVMFGLLDAGRGDCGTKTTLIQPSPAGGSSEKV